MLRVLTLSTLFPTRERPQFGVFVEGQTRALAAREEVVLEVVSGVGVPPWPLSRLPHYAERARLPEREEWDGLVVHRPRYRALPLLGRGGDARALARAALPAARRFRPDVIDAEFFWPDGVAAMHLAEALGVPFSIKARGSDIAFWGVRPGVREQMLAAAAAAGGLLAVSESLKREMVAPGMPAGKIRVHYTGIDLERFRPRDRAEAKRRIGVEGPLFACVGALIPLKGQRLAIEALSQVGVGTLLIVGEGPERSALEAASRRLGKRVRFLGGVGHDDLPAILAAADAMVLPSEREGLANVWVEALACGTPVVIPDVGGAREVVDHPEAGRIVARNPEAIAEALRDLLAAPPDPQAVRRSAERFSWERNSAELFDHLSRVSAERH